MVLTPGLVSGLAIVFSLALQVQAQGSQPNLAGRISEADSGAPIKGATITLVPPIIAGRLNFQTAKTDSNGNYYFEKVAEGTYYIMASADGFVRQDYNRNGSPWGAFLHFDPSARFQGIDFQLAHEAVIRGTVVEKDGKPVANLPVAAIGPPGNDGRPGHIEALEKTDALGQFALRGLPAGTYLIGANESAWYNDGPTPSLPYRETWYGGAASRAGAIPIALKEGDERNDLRITVEPEMRHRVIVWPSGPLGATAPVRYEVTIERRNFITMKQANGSYVIPDMPPGHYTLITTAWAPVQYLGKGEKGIDVTHSDLTVHVRLDGLGEIAGTANWDGAPVESSGRALFMIESEEGAIQEVRVNAHGHFDVSKVLPGKYLFIPLQVAPIAVPRSVQCRGKEVSDDSPLQIGDRQKALDCHVTLANP
ncbi:MAG: carboxypeptidase regulatory-like domain-containing protein [Terracidiphilus sp.]